MLRNALYLKFFLLLMVLAVLALALGNEPWGPT